MTVGYHPPQAPSDEDTWLKAVVASDALQLSNIVRDENGVVESASVIWPNGVAGAQETTQANSGRALAYTVTYKAKSVNVTRDEDGLITEIEIAGA